MKFFHLADLHIGKTINNYSMLDDQKHIFQQIISAVQKEKPNAILIAGDIYDKAMPSTAAVSLFDDFLTELAKESLPILCISGNHDSPERLSFAGRIIESSNIYIAPPYEGKIQSVCLQDEQGEIDFHLLPFLRPAMVKNAFPDAEIDSYQSALKTALSATRPDPQKRNVLLAHQFVTAIGEELERSDSETDPIGGLNNIDFRLFDAYDYVALGHLHGPQRIGRDSVRYAGSPLKYSFSEEHQHKSITQVLLNADGSSHVDFIPLIPLHDMRKIRGTIDELLSKEFDNKGNPEDYLHITLTDEAEIVDPIGKLRSVYPNIMELAFGNSRSRASFSINESLIDGAKTSFELFEEFYEEQNNLPLSASQQAIVKKLLENMEESL